MTKRLYFTCPIKALYMMKEFGVKFECQSSETVIIDDVEREDLTLYDFTDWGVNAENISELLESFKNDYPKKIYVTSESERIFEPKYWDLGRCFKKHITANFIDGEWSNGTVKFDLKTTKIIMRDNKKFFAAEVEND